MKIRTRNKTFGYCVSLELELPAIRNIRLVNDYGNVDANDADKDGHTSLTIASHNSALFLFSYLLYDFCGFDINST